MRIQSMQIKNYRRFVDTSINFSKELTVLAGANNSGKTSLVHMLDSIFSGKSNLKAKDITLTVQMKIINILLNMFCSRFETSIPSDIKELRLEMQKLLINKDDDTPKINEECISVKLAVCYEQGEAISAFARYLMDLDDTKRFFYFEIVQEINVSSLKRNIDENADTIKEYLERFFSANKNLKDCNPELPEYGALHAKVEKSRQLLAEKLFKLYGDCLDVIYKYANEDYSISHKMEKKEFIALFNYKYLSADRQLNDNVEGGRRTLTSSVVDLLNIERESISSPGEWRGKIKELLGKMFDALNQAEMDTYLVGQARSLLGNIATSLNVVGDTNIQEITMVLDFGMDFLYQVLKDSIRVNYAIPTDTQNSDSVLLSEESQGLGISNLILITLELMRYKFLADKRLVNVFIIEEPEAHMHLQMQRTLINFLNLEYAGTSDTCTVQGVITTHSDEIVRSANLKDIKVIRPKEPLRNDICDMELFLERHQNEKAFYETFFKINFSNMVFADKAIIYEGDTERMYIESLIFGKRTEDEKAKYGFLDALSQKYITYAQAGGAYSHKYAELLNELEISTLILTDIDYSKSCLTKQAVLDQKTTNASLNFFCPRANRQETEVQAEAADFATASPESTDDVAVVYSAAENATEAEGIVMAPTTVVKAATDATDAEAVVNIVAVGGTEADGIVMTTVTTTKATEVAAEASETDTEEEIDTEVCICVKDIYSWQASCEKAQGILVRTQTESDGCARTLEEAILYQYIKNNYSTLFTEGGEASDLSVFKTFKKSEWTKIRDTSGFSFSLPNNKRIHLPTKPEKVISLCRCIREIVKSTSDKKSDFMYSIIIKGKQYEVLPNYIKEGLEWLSQK